MLTTTSKNKAIEFFRFAFITVIVLWHFSNICQVFQHGGLAVDFFFVLAGALLYRSYFCHPGRDAVQYTFRRIKRICIEWVLILLFLSLSLKTGIIYLSGIQ